MTTFMCLDFAIFWLFVLGVPLTVGVVGAFLLDKIVQRGPFRTDYGLLFTVTFFFFAVFVSVVTTQVIAAKYEIAPFRKTFVETKPVTCEKEIEYVRHP